MEFKEGSINSDESLRFNNEDQKIIVNGNDNIKIKNINGNKRKYCLYNGVVYS